MKKILILARGDIRNIIRDPFLIFMCCIPIIMAVSIHFLLPFINHMLIQYLGFTELADYYPFILSVLVLVTPMLLGTVIGFVLLDERDENILTYFYVTPLTKKGYFFYKISFSSLIKMLG